jgi:hypothetical protein
VRQYGSERIKGRPLWQATAFFEAGRNRRKEVIPIHPIFEPLRQPKFWLRVVQVIKAILELWRSR